MKCPYQDIGCGYIDDVSHNCEAETASQCRHESPEPEQSRKHHNEDDEE